MSLISVHGFANEAAAQAFFDQAKQTANIDAVFLKTKARIQYSRELGDFDVVEGSRVFTVITFPPGTPIQLDSGASGEAEPEE